MESKNLNRLFNSDEVRRDDPRQLLGRTGLRSIAETEQNSQRSTSVPDGEGVLRNDDRAPATPEAPADDRIEGTTKAAPPGGLILPGRLGEPLSEPKYNPENQ